MLLPCTHNMSGKSVDANKRRHRNERIHGPRADPAVAWIQHTCSDRLDTCDTLDPCSHAIKHFGEHLRVCPSSPDWNMERMVGILNRRQCYHPPEPFNQGQQKRHSRERIASSLQEGHRHVHMCKVLRARCCCIDGRGGRVDPNPRLRSG